jgi:excisionase family DNA binding protein
MQTLTQGDHPGDTPTPTTLITVATAAEILGVSDRDVRRRITSGEIAATRGHVRNAWLIDPADLPPASPNHVAGMPLTDFVDALAALTGHGEAEDDESWRWSARCAQSDPDAWFPDNGAVPRSAIEICNGCPVRAQCLQWALTHDERFGIWGGMSERQLRRLRRLAA